MITYIENKNINKLKWDQCIQASSNACIFVYSWYLDVVSENWSAIIMGDYEAVLPLASKSKYKINYLIQPFFTRYFGVFSKMEISENLLNNFMEAIPGKFKHIEFCLHESNKFHPKSFKISERRYQYLNLSESHKNLKRNYSDNAKRNVNKAVKAGLTIKENVDPELVVNLFKTTKGQELEVFKPSDYNKLIQLMHLCTDHNKSEAYAVFDKEENLCAGAFFMKMDNRFIFLKSGVTTFGKAKGAMHLLFDTFIRKHSESDKTLDFGGSSVETVARFYKNFGAKDCVYLRVKKNSLSRIAKFISGKV